MTISGERTEQFDIFCHVNGFTRDFLSFIDVELIRFFHGALQFSGCSTPLNSYRITDLTSTSSPEPVSTTFYRFFETSNIPKTIKAAEIKQSMHNDKFTGLLWQSVARRTVFRVTLRQRHTNWLNTRQLLVFYIDQLKIRKNNVDGNATSNSPQSTLHCITQHILTFPSVLHDCWLSDRKDIRPVKNWVLVCWW